MRPDERSPGPSGPAALSPTGGSCRRAALTAADAWSSCQRTSSVMASVRSGAERSAAFAAYAAAPSAWAHIWQTAAACPAARAAAAAAGSRTSLAGTPPEKRRRIPSATSRSPRENVRARAMRSRGRPSLGAEASKISSTCSAQSAAHAATARRSASLSVCGERTPQSFQPDLPVVPQDPATGRMPGTGSPCSRLFVTARASALHPR
jgi:hypothetical protein